MGVGTGGLVGVIPWSGVAIGSSVPRSLKMRNTRLQGPSIMAMKRAKSVMLTGQLKLLRDILVPIRSQVKIFFRIIRIWPMVRRLPKPLSPRSINR